MVVGVFLLGILVICTVALLVWYCCKKSRYAYLCDANLLFVSLQSKDKFPPDR